MAARIIVVLLLSLLLEETVCQISDAEQLEILDAHNWLRAKVNPTAANMQKLVMITPTKLCIQNM